MWVAVLDRVDATAPGLPLGLLLDVYHLATNGDDVDAVIATHGRRVAHVQLADAPGRGEPGTGRLDIPGYLAALRAAGYTGHVGLEYRPTTDTMSSLAWLPYPERGQFAERGDNEPEETGA